MSDQSNPDARPEPLRIDQFEGEYVRVMRGKIPGITLAMDEGFARGTVVKLQVEARVRNVGYQEATDKDHKGELVRHHDFSIEEVALVGSMTAEESDPGVGGSAVKQVEERDDFGTVVMDCWYDASDLILYHRGSCDICYRRVPAEVVNATVAAHLPGHQSANDPGF